MPELRSARKRWCRGRRGFSASRQALRTAGATTAAAAQPSA